MPSTPPTTGSGGCRPGQAKNLPMDFKTSASSQYHSEKSHKGVVSHLALPMRPSGEASHLQGHLQGCFHCLVVFVFVDSVSLCDPNCPGIHFVYQAGFKLIEILLFLPPKCGIKGMCHHACLNTDTFGRQTISKYILPYIG